MSRFLVGLLLLAVVPSGLFAEQNRTTFEHYLALLESGNMQGVFELLHSMSKADLVAACRDWHDASRVKLPQGDEHYHDGPRGAVPGFMIGPLLQSYRDLSLKEGPEIDPTPFHRMMLDSSLDDPDFRKVLIEAFGSPNFYKPSWKFIGDDVKTYVQLASDRSLDLLSRLQALENISLFVMQLYMSLYNQSAALRRFPLDPDLRRRVFPDVSEMLRKEPGQFSPAEVQRLSVLKDASVKATTVALGLLHENDTEITRRWLRNSLRTYVEMHLLGDDPALRSRLEQLLKETAHNNALEPAG